MSGIAGIAQSGRCVRVNRMPDKMAYRGQAGRAVFEVDGVTLGQIGSEGASMSVPNLNQAQQVCDAAGPGHLAWAQVTDNQLVLSRDQVGVASLYFGRTYEDDFKRERHLPDGSQLNSKKELLYYRLFREHFGEFNDLTWLGRTIGTPVQDA